MWVHGYILWRDVSSREFKSRYCLHYGCTQECVSWHFHMWLTHNTYLDGTSEVKTNCVGPICRLESCMLACYPPNHCWHYYGDCPWLFHISLHIADDGPCIRLIAVHVGLCYCVSSWFECCLYRWRLVNCYLFSMAYMLPHYWFDGTRRFHDTVLSIGCCMLHVTWSVLRSCCLFKWSHCISNIWHTSCIACC